MCTNIDYFLQVKFTKTGICHGFVLWIDWVMDSQNAIVISTGPGKVQFPWEEFC